MSYLNVFILDGCFQTPTCYDQSNFTLSDSHEVGAVLFNMDVPVPTGAFSGQTFSGLRFSIANSSLDVATINTTTGTVELQWLEH